MKTLKLVLIALVISVLLLPLMPTPAHAYTSDTFYIAGTNDGFEQYYNASAAWATIIAGSGNGSSNDNAIACSVYIEASTTSNEFIRCYRDSFFFDTSGLPDDAVITGATFSIRGYSKNDGLSCTPNLALYNTSSTNTTVADADYQASGSTLMSNNIISYGDFSTAGYNDFTLNAAGIASISATGRTRFTVRNQNYDVSEVSPNWISGQHSGLYIYYGEQGAGYQPKLVIDYYLPQSTTHYLPLIITENAGTSYAQLPVSIDIDNTTILSSSVYVDDVLNVCATDANGTQLPTMVVDDRTLISSAIPANTGTNLKLTFGSDTPRTSQEIITGSGGYITIDRHAEIEPGDDFLIDLQGYVDTDAGDGKVLVYKQGSLALWVDALNSGYIYAGLCDTPESAEQTADTNNYGLASDAYVRMGEYLTTSPMVISSISFELKKFGSPTGTLSVVVRDVATDSIVGTIGTKDVSTIATDFTWYDFDTTPVPVLSGRYRLSAEYSGGSFGGGNYVGVKYEPSDEWGDGNNLFTYNASIYTDNTNGECAIKFEYDMVTTIQTTDVDSGEYRIRMGLSSNTFSIQFDNDTPNTTAYTSTVPYPDTDYFIGQGDSLPYLNYFKLTINGTEEIWYQPDSVISGTTLDNRDPGDIGLPFDAVITYGTNPAGISITTGDMTPLIYHAQLSSVTTPSINPTATPTAPPQMYTELDTSKVPGAEAVTTILGLSSTPEALWWFPFIFLALLITAMLIYDATQHTGAQGSHLAMFIVIECGLLFFGILGETGVGSLIPLWCAYLFPIGAIPVIMSKRHTSW